MADFTSLYFLLLWLLASTAAAHLDAPHNVTVITLNTNYTLSWEWEWSAAHSQTVTFTTQCLARFKLRKKSPNWTTVCDETPERTCDLTALNLHYLGIFMIRVRANVNNSHSVWVQKEFCPDKDAQVGPPTKVDLAPAGSNLNVFISDPLTSSNRSMKELLPKLFYHVVYWEKPHGPVLTMNNEVNTLTLLNLKPWTWYCVSIQSRCDFYNKSSSFTSPQCIQTEGAVPWWQIFVYFLASLLISLLVMLPVLYGSFLFYKKLRATLYPPSSLPPHFKDFFHSSGSDTPSLHILDSESELLCDRIIVCQEQPQLDRPPSAEDLQPESRHSHQASDSSGDSGVYSTGAFDQSFSGAEDCSGGSFAPELLKVQKIKRSAPIPLEDIIVIDVRL